MNQGFFTKLFIGEDGNVERAALSEPFAELLGHLGTDTREAEATQVEADVIDSTEPESTEGADGLTIGERLDGIRRRARQPAVYRVREDPERTNPWSSGPDQGFERDRCGGGEGIRTLAPGCPSLTI